jgi:superfamily II DNA or RNA helicase
VIKIRETPTRLLLSGSKEDLQTLAKHYEFRPDGFWMADSFQIYKRWKASITAAFKNGNFALAESLESKPRGWDGWKRLLKLQFDGQCASGILARGHLNNLLELAWSYDIKVDKSELLRNPFEGITIDDIPDDLLNAELDGEQWEIQKRCVLAWLSHGIGRNKVTVSGGKTAMFCAAAAMVKLKFPTARFLYFTPSERLSKQVFTEAKRFLPDWNITKFGGGADRDNTGTDMVVCTGAILNARREQLVIEKWFSTFICLLIDECHYAASPSWSRALLASSAYFRFAASDTSREDNVEANLALTGLTGPIYERVEAIDLIEIDRIASPLINVIDVPGWTNRFDHLTHEVQLETPAWILANGEWLKGTYLGPVFELKDDGDFKLDRRKRPIKIPGLWLIKVGEKHFNVESRWCLLERKYDQAIIRFNERNALIVNKAVEYANRGWSTLIVATRTLHVMILEAMLGKSYDPDLVKVLYSAHSPEERDSVFAWLKQTPGSILISPLVKIGVSINELRGGVIADFVSDSEYANQLIGRFIRKKPDGTTNEAEISIFAENQLGSYRRIHTKLFSKLKRIQGYRWCETVI